MQESPVFISSEAILDRTGWEHNGFLNDADEQTVVPIVSEFQ